MLYEQHCQPCVVLTNMVDIDASIILWISCIEEFPDAKIRQ